MIMMLTSPKALMGLSLSLSYLFSVDTRLDKYASLPDSPVNTKIVFGGFAAPAHPFAIK